MLRRAQATLSTALASVLLAALTNAPQAVANPVAGASPSARSAAPEERTLRLVVVQRSRVRVDLVESASVRRIQPDGALPRRWDLRKGVLSGWVPRGRRVVRVRAISTRLGERGQRVRVKVVLVGRPPVARRGTVLLTRGPGGRPGNGSSRVPLVSADGSIVAFLSDATNLVSPPLPGSGSRARAFAWDRSTGRTEVLSVAPDGAPIPGYGVSLSADGSKATFLSGGTLHLRDRTTARTRVLAQAVDRAVLSADGAAVTFASGTSTWRADLRTGALSDLGIAPFMASSPDGRHLAVVEDGRFYIWDTQTRRVVRERALELPEYCRWHVSELSNDALRAVVGGGCDHSTYAALVDTEDDRWLVSGDSVDANDSATWVVAANGRGRVVAGPVDGPLDVVSEQPARNVTDVNTTSGRPFVALSGEGGVVAWSVGGRNVVRNATSEHHQVYIWTPGR